VRDAFGVLEQRGLISAFQTAGAVVARLDLSRSSNSTAVREMLEGLCVRLAVEPREAASWQDLVQLFGRAYGSQCEAWRLEKIHANLDQLRNRTLEAAGNGVLADMLDSINDKTREIQAPHHHLPGRAAEGCAAPRGARRDAQGRRRQSRELRRANIRSSREYLERYQSFVL